MYGILIGGSLWWLFLRVATVIVERTITEVPTGVLVIVAAVLAALALPIIYREWIKGRPPKRDKRKSKFSDFDMPVLAAIEHMKQTVAHQWDSQDKAEWDFWRRIHEQMRAGHLRVIGAEVPGDPLRRISRRKLAKLTSVTTSVTPSETAPDGARFDLIDEAKSGEPRVTAGSFPGFYDLRIRNKELHRLWPRTCSQKGDGE